MSTTDSKPPSLIPPAVPAARTSEKYRTNSIGTRLAFVVGKAVGLVNEDASASYIQLYKGNASLLTESLEVVQQAASIILAALEPPIADDVINEELAEVAA